ncbi:MAG: porin family protein, partial [Bacteroidota bacterium]
QSDSFETIQLILTQLQKNLIFQPLFMKYTLTFFGLLMVALLHAQSNNLPQWHFGVKADFNLTNISGKGMASGYTAGVQGGVYAERTFNNKWSIQPELLLSQNNTKRSDDADFFTYYNDRGNPYAAKDVKLAYISIPVMLKYNVTPAFSFLAGPQYGLLIVDAESLITSNFNNSFKKSEFSANAGAQLNVGRVSIYGRYNQGFSNVQNIPNDNRYAWRSSHIQLGVAVRLL